nr:unnamed protein product [Digitaria exilis]
MPDNDHGDGQQQTNKDDHLKRGFFDKSIGTAADLSKLLPTGTTMAFQTMAPSFTRGGTCGEHEVINVAFTWWLIVFLTLLCAVLSFTDSVRGKDGHTYYYGIAMPKRLVLFNHDENELELADELRKKPSSAPPFVFIIFPSERNGIGVETAPHPHTAAAPPDGGKTPATPTATRNAGEHAPAGLHLQQLQSRASARPRALGVMLRRTSSHDELDSVV